MDKAEIEKLINDWFDNDRGSTGEKLNRKELSIALTALIIKWLEEKRKTVWILQERQLIDKLITELVEELK